MTSTPTKQKNFDFEEFTLNPEPAEATLDTEDDLPPPPLPPLPPLPPQTAAPPPSPIADGVMVSHLKSIPIPKEIKNKLPILSLNQAPDNVDYEWQRQWMISKFTPHVNEFPRLRDHFLRQHACRSTPDNPGAWDWINTFLVDMREVKNEAINLLQCDEQQTTLRELIKAKACFAIYQNQQAPEYFRMPDKIFKRYVPLIWRWTLWLNSYSDK
jgi:hypothetical protein